MRNIVICIVVIVIGYYLYMNYFNQDTGPVLLEDKLIDIDSDEDSELDNLESIFDKTENDQSDDDITDTVNEFSPFNFQRNNLVIVYGLRF